MVCLTVNAFRYLSMFFSLIISLTYFGYLIYMLFNDDQWNRFSYLVIVYWFLSVVLNGLNELTKSMFFLSLSFMFILQALVVSVGHFHPIGYLILSYALFLSFGKFVLEIVIIRYKTKQAKNDAQSPNQSQSLLQSAQYPAAQSPIQSPIQSPVQMPATTVFILPSNQAYQPQISYVIAPQPPADRYQPILNSIEKTKKSKLEVTILRIVAYLFTIGYFEYCGLRFWLDIFDIPNHAFKPIQLLFPVDLVLIQLVLLYLVEIIIYRKDIQLLYAIIFLTGCALILFLTGHYYNFSILVAYLIIISVIYLCKLYYKKSKNSKSSSS